jgi:hypothetical protein
VLTRRAHILLVVTLVVVWVAGVSALTLALVVPDPPPAGVPVPAPLGPPATRHLLLVVVDGLRHDVATDPARMPAFARRMREHTSGEIWSSPVSMTSSAVLTYGTGQRGDIDQIVNNETGRPTRFNHLIGNARAAGPRTAVVGDNAWFFLYDGFWDWTHRDPDGVAIDVDFGAETFAAAAEMLALAPLPNLMVVHFVSPDHQGHAHRVDSARYRAYIAGFDAELDALLRRVPAQVTVIVTSDHGATPSGTHGSDHPDERRSPIFAYGPGLVDRRHSPRPLEQIDLPSTFAALLGVPAPAHGRGHVLVDWLGLADDAARARVACADLERLQRYASEVVPASAPELAAAREACPPGGEARATIAAAAAAARGLDRAIDRQSAHGAPRGWVVPVLALGGAMLLAALVLWRSAPLELVAAVALVLGAVHADQVAGALALVAAAAALALWRDRALAWVDGRVLAGALVVPGLLVTSYTRYTQIGAYALAALIVALALAARPAVRRAAPWRVAAVLALVALLAPLGFAREDFLPLDLARRPGPLLALALASLALLAAWRHGHARAAGRPAPLGFTLAGLGLALASLVLRRSAPPTVCLAGWIGLGALALALCAERPARARARRALGAGVVDLGVARRRGAARGRHARGRARGGRRARPRARHAAGAALAGARRRDLPVRLGLRAAPGGAARPRLHPLRLRRRRLPRRRRVVFARGRGRGLQAPGAARAALCGGAGAARAGVARPGGAWGARRRARARGDAAGRAVRRAPLVLGGDARDRRRAARAHGGAGGGGGVGGGHVARRRIGRAHGARCTTTTVGASLSHAGCGRQSVRVSVIVSPTSDSENTRYSRSSPSTPHMRSVASPSSSA